MTAQYEDWMSSEMIRAEREFDAAIEQAHQALDEVRAFREEMETDQARQDDEDAKIWAAYANGESASPQWQRVAERVEDGEFTWLDVALGTVAEDPDVKAALAASREAYERSQEEQADRAGNGDDGGSAG